MPKYAGLVGYVTEEETSKGVWSHAENVRTMRGDVLRAASVFQGTEQVNKDITMQNRISLVGDPYAFEHCSEIRWVSYIGQKWQVTNIDIIRPRIILVLGRKWNG